MSTTIGAAAIRAATLLVALAVTAATAAAADTRIEWRVENPFRLFTDPADTEMHRATFAALSGRDRRTPILAAERALAERHEDGWAATIAGETCWNAARNRYMCPTPAAYINPTSHAVILEARSDTDISAADCTWLTAPHGPKARRGEAITRPCREPVRVEIPYPAGAGVTLEIAGAEAATATVKVQDLLIVGMGDSFGSGEGNPDVPVRFSRERAVDYANAKSDTELVGYPARVGAWKQIGDKEFLAGNAKWLDQACHRSLYSHQSRAALQLAIEDPHRAVTFVGVACSGAEVTAGLFLRYKGNEWVPNPPDLSQISYAAEAQCGGRQAPLVDLPEAYHMNGAIPDLQGGLVLKKCDAELARRIDILMLSIGGNDIGFARLVANAVLSDETILKRLGGWFGHVFGKTEAAQRLATLDDRYKSLNRAFHNLLHVPWNESDRIILTAYPGMALLEDGRTVCPSGRAGMDALSSFALSAQKARIGQEAADELNDIMKRSAREHGWTFADGHRAAFLGRGICAGYSDNAFSTADDLRLPRRIDGEWHPYNPADYRPYASRQRWFRTPNDAFLTGNFHVSASVMQSVLKSQSLQWVQLLLATTYSGAFHPTAEGHAAIADAVAEKARAVIEKYSNRHREK